MAEREFLLEVRCEEIPARMVAKGVQQLATRFFEELVAAKLVPEEVITGFTPRRLALCLKGLPEREPDRREQVVGPPAAVAWKNGAPTPALEGFAARCGVAPEAVQRVETAKGEYAVVDQTVTGRDTRDLLQELTPRLLADIRWPKEMRWATGEGPWVRPVHGLLAIYGGEVVPCTFFGVAAGRETRGHPLLSPEPFEVASYEEYTERLRERGIEILFATRRERLLRRAEELAAEAGGTLVEDDELLDRLASVCAVPGMVQGTIDEEHLELPREVLIASLRDHQSALTVEREGELLPCFLTVMDRADDPEGLVKSGNEWVVAARLADARFFWQADLELPLSARDERLAHLSFHEKLGSYAEKSVRIEQLAVWLCDALERPQLTEPARRAARTLKADLTTEMVKEFTSLQGVMGGVYARQEGAPEEVWQAIYDQYLPTSTDDPLPRGVVGRVVSLADRFDTLAGMFGLGAAPTGSRDPFGLRRAAQGAMRILLEGELAIDPEALAAQAARLYDDRLEVTPEQVVDALRPFLQDRVRHLLGLTGFAYDEIEAALATAWRDLPDLAARVAAVHATRQRPGFLDVVLAAKRIANILREQPPAELDESLLREDAERHLHQAGRELDTEIVTAAQERDYERGLAAVAELAEVLERFFTEVLVMDENPDMRRNRLALLQRTQGTLSRIARLQEVVVEKSRDESTAAGGSAAGGGA